MNDLSQFTADAPLILVGCGNMGRALLRGWRRSGLKPSGLIVVDPLAKEQPAPGAAGAHVVDTVQALPAGTRARVMVLAVKPQMMNEVLAGARPVCSSDTLVLSVAAGVTIAQLHRGLGNEPAIVRTMPNTPAAIGAGVTGLTAEQRVSDGDKALADTLMQAAGKTVWIEDEALMDAVTATSGSGPAYVFHMVEALAVAAEQAGLPADAAMLLARQTVIGAAHLLEADGDVAAAELRRRVTSPGGTTAAALDVLMANEGLIDLMTRAVAAAKRRGEELAD